MTANNSTREFSRVKPRFDVVLTTDDGATRKGQTQNVSMNGLYLECEDPFPVGTGCAMKLLLAEPDSSFRIEARAQVVRTTSTGLALQFAELNMNSYEHLRNLVLHNSVNYEKTKQEIEGHWGLKRPT